MKLSEILKKYREENKISQREFARRCQLSNSLISILEMGTNPQTGKPMEPDLKTYRRLASGMGMTEKELLDEICSDNIPRINKIKIREPRRFKYVTPGLRVRGVESGKSNFEIKMVTSSNRQTIPGNIGKVVVVDADPELHSILKMWKSTKPERKKDIARVVKAMTEEE